MAYKGETTTRRIPLTPSTLDRFREFCNGMKVSYDEAINILLDQFVEPDEKEILAGLRLRGKLTRRQPQSDKKPT